MRRVPAEGVTVPGTVACVQHCTNGLVLSLGAEGSIDYGAWGLAASIDGVVLTRPRQDIHELSLPADESEVRLVSLHDGGRK